ncbi:zinc finger, CCHC-type containing protein [Tanacetum coccineum]
MGDKNPIRTLGDYSKPSHEGYRNTIDAALISIRSMDSFQGLTPKSPSSWHRPLLQVQIFQHLKDFLKLVDSLNLDGENRERTRLHLFQFSLRNQASYWLECLPAGSISMWGDLTTRFLAQFFPPGRTTKLRNDILMFQQHHGESLSEAWARFKDLLQKVPNHGIDRWLQIQIFYDHVSFHLKCEIDRAGGGKPRNKNTDESWEIIENLTLYDHEGWDETKEFVKPVRAIYTPQGIPKTPDRRLLELEDQINFLLKGSRPMPTSSSAHTPQAYVNAVHPNSRSQNQNDPPILSTFAFRERTGPSPQPQALETTFEAQSRDYMAAHTERMERFENTIRERKFYLSDKKRRRKDIGDLKHVNTLIDQGSDVNVMPYSTYMRLTDERPAETDIRLSLASHSYIYPLGIAEDVLVEVAEHVFPFEIGTINLRLVLEWEERIKLHLKKEMKFNQWRSNNLKNKQPAPVKVEGGMDDDGEVT